MLKTGNTRRMALILMAVFLSAGALCAQDDVLIGKFFGVGARAMGMGGAFVAVADDYSALFWNPAGLAQIHRLELSGSLSHERYTNETAFYGNGVNDSQSKTRLNALGFTYPVPTVRGSLVLSAGYNRVSSFDGLMTMAGYRTPTQFADAWETESGGLGMWSFGGAMDVSPSLSFGATLDIWSGDDSYSWDYMATDAQNPHSDVRYLDTIDGDYTGVGLKFAGLIRANRPGARRESAAGETVA